MRDIIRLSEAASLGLHALVLLAKPGTGRLTVKEMAEQMGASPAHLSKVVQQLSRLGFVRSKSGPGGGVELQRPPGEISLLQVYEALEGPYRVGGCPLGREVCPFRGCIFGGLFSRVQEQVTDFLEHTTLGDFWGDEKGDM
ncbi:putative transcriptional regulator [Thermanaerovibrio velox DSM 12556]|uniref:Putative transcriptional regulator n=1 Tax=Thermanaerovibrio velox DSM 12556 TaxID=926567 RepID=H0URE9_9BACT|nr:Rrf2 family transcriptional regulator [Thermanaerovibrio velox]EHM10918.1 putative transcriptional regulator [Thermanaerovibrio velox DSM 12556]